ncbi:MAG TPA: hypothetical protein VGC00_12655 [Thermoanaerobaculia bacterium]
MRAILALLPLLALGAAMWALRRRGWSWRFAAPGGAVVWGASLVGLTEALSLLGALRPLPVALGWSAAAFAMVAVGRRAAAPAVETSSSVARPLRAAGRELLLLVLVGCVLAVTLLVALAATPNNFDSMLYHLPRVRHWQQQASVAHFATHNLKQIYFPPFAEFVVLHLRLLVGSDALANLVQWLAFVGAVAGSSAIAAELGAARQGRLVAAFVAATIPMAILQATSTQTDEVAAFWAVAVVLLGLRLRRRGGGASLVLAGGAAGLLLLTKATGAAVALPFLLWCTLARLRRARRRGVASAPLVAAAAGAALFAAALVAGHASRNARVFGEPLGPPEFERYLGAGPLAATTMSNALRNSASLLAGPWHAWNRSVAGATSALHAALALERRGPITTFADEPFRVPDRWRHESSAGAPLHLLLFAVAAGLAWTAPARRWRAVRRAYFLCLLSGFVLFAALFRWQTANARLLLPALVLMAPWVGTALAGGRTRRLALAAALVLAVAATPPLLANEIRPLFGGESVFTSPPSRQLFAGRPREGPHLRGLLARLRAAGCDRVGLITNQASYEYPVWALLEGISPGGPHIRHVRVRDVSAPAGAGEPPFAPCAVLRLWGGVKPAELLAPPAPDPTRRQPALAGAPR